MNPVIFIICILVVSFVVFFIVYTDEKKSKKKDKMTKDLVDDPSILFEKTVAVKEDEKSHDDLEII